MGCPPVKFWMYFSDEGGDDIIEPLQGEALLMLRNVELKTFFAPMNMGGTPTHNGLHSGHPLFSRTVLSIGIRSDILNVLHR